MIWLWDVHSVVLELSVRLVVTVVLSSLHVDNPKVTRRTASISRAGRLHFPAKSELTLKYFCLDSCLTNWITSDCYDKNMPDITSAVERRDLSGWNPAREPCCLQYSCFSSFHNRRTLRQCLATRYRVAWSFRVKRARFSRVIRRDMTRVAKAELQLRINRYDFVYTKFGWGSRLIVGHF